MMTVMVMVTVMMMIKIMIIMIIIIMIRAYDYCYVTFSINNPRDLKNYAMLCEEAGMPVNPLPGQSCHVVKLY